MSTITIQNIRSEIDRILVETGSDKDRIKNNPDETFDFYGIDSMDKVELVMELEDHYGIDIPDDIWENSATPNKLAEEIHKYMEFYESRK